MSDLKVLLKTMIDDDPELCRACGSDDLDENGFCRNCGYDMFEGVPE